MAIYEKHTNFIGSSMCSYSLVALQIAWIAIVIESLR